MLITIYSRSTAGGGVTSIAVSLQACPYKESVQFPLAAGIGALENLQGNVQVRSLQKKPVTYQTHSQTAIP